MDGSRFREGRGTPDNVIMGGGGGGMAALESRAFGATGAGIGFAFATTARPKHLTKDVDASSLCGHNPLGRLGARGARGKTLF